MRNLNNLKNLRNGDLFRIFANETEELFQTERQLFLGVLHNNKLLEQQMNNLVSKEQPTPKIGAMEMKHSRHIWYSLIVSANEVEALYGKHTAMQCAPPCCHQCTCTHRSVKQLW